MSTIDDRNQGIQYPIARYEASKINCPKGATAEVTTTLRVNMTVKTIVVRAGACDGDITFTVAVRDDNGATHFSKASIAKNAKTVLLSTKSTQDFPEFCLNGTITVGVTPSGDPVSDAGVDVNVDLYGV